MAAGGGPLGKYSQSVAAIVAVGVIASAVAARFFGTADSFVDNMALIAMGAVFGAAASTAVNGDKIEAAHKRLDIIAAPAAQSTDDPIQTVTSKLDEIVAAVNGPAVAERLAASLERGRVQRRDIRSDVPASRTANATERTADATERLADE